MDTQPAGSTARRLVGVYHADGSLLGELRYWVGARLGSAHCSLCDITHGTFRAKPEWVSRCGELGVPFETVHLDERDPQLLAATESRTPCVVAETDDGYVMLLDPATLVACSGSVDALFRAATEAAERVGLSLGAVS
jgi:hypothetical protein